MKNSFEDIFMRITTELKLCDKVESHYREVCQKMYDACKESEQEKEVRDRLLVPGARCYIPEVGMDYFYAETVDGINMFASRFRDVERKKDLYNQGQYKVITTGWVDFNKYLPPVKTVLKVRSKRKRLLGWELWVYDDDIGWLEARRNTYIYSDVNNYTVPITTEIKDLQWKYDNDEIS